MNALFEELAGWNEVLRHCEGLEEALAAAEISKDIAPKATKKIGADAVIGGHGEVSP